MTTPAQKPPGTGGGSIATRGLLVQTLVALLDVVQADPPFTEITLEPAFGDEQFDFVWKDHADTYATQVKSTINLFKKSDVEEWARKLEAARSTEHCCLMLVGLIHPSLEHVSQVGKVAIHKKNLDLPGLLGEAAHDLAKFLEAEQMPAGTGLQREMVVHALVSKLEHLAEKSAPLSRESFLKLLRQWINAAPKGEVQIDLSHFDVLKYAPADLIGRESETKTLYDAWLQAVRGEPKRPHVLTFVALGGEGKTSLVAKWAAGLAHQDWPGCDAAFAWSFYSQGTRDQAVASSDTFLKDALTFFGDPAMAGSAQHASDKGRRLAQLVGERRALLILDGLEPLQYAPTSPTPGELKDQGLAVLLKGLAATSHGLCVVTTRYSIPDLRAYWQTTAPEVKLLRLSKAAGVALLRQLGVKTGSKEDFEKLVEDVDGHALTLQIMGGFLKKAFHGDIRCRDRVKFERADAKVQGGHAFRAMAAYVKWMEDQSEEAQRELAVLRLMGLFDRPATADCINALLKTPVITGLTEALVDLEEENWNCSLDALESAKLLTVHRDAAGTLLSLDAHPLLREYFGGQLRQQQPDAWRAAHRRLYEHLCATTKEGDQPTLEDLQPLYQAVAHGCQAGMQQEVYNTIYIARILRREELHSLRKLGAFGSDLGAVACFFETLWSRVSPALAEADQAMVLSQAAVSLRALGRLTEAIEPMRAGLDSYLELEHWEYAARCASNLSELKLMMGEVAWAVGDAEQSVTYADRSGDAFLRMVTRAKTGEPLLQSGRRAEAEARFREAEALQAKRQPEYPLLNSLWGFRYCDLLLTEAERGVWQAIQKSGVRIQKSELVEVCREVEKRAAQTLKWEEEENRLLDIALNHLTLGRAAFYAAMLVGSSLDPCHSFLDSAVDGLRHAGDTTRLPCGLLPRAWCSFAEAAEHRLRGDHAQAAECEARARADLDEAWEIAERGPMRLFMADIYLYRARLFHAVTPYPWDKDEQGKSRGPRDDLAATRKVIEQCGYHRRDEELADAEEAAKSW